MKVTYSGHLSVTYMDYVDLATGKALFVEPGKTYDIRPVGFGALDIPVSNFTLAEPKKQPKKKTEEELIPAVTPKVEENNV